MTQTNPFAISPFSMGSLAFEWWRLWMESTQVIALRSMRMMQGGAVAQREAVRMVSEKWETAALVGMKAMSGDGGHTAMVATQKAVRQYRSRVSANRRRLVRSSLRS